MGGSCFFTVLATASSWDVFSASGEVTSMGPKNGPMAPVQFWKSHSQHGQP